MKYTMQNGKTLLIVSGGSIDINFSKEYIKDKKYDRIIAADSGLAHCKEIGIEPTDILGDFDSLKNKELLEEYRKKGIPLREFPTRRLHRHPSCSKIRSRFKTTESNNSRCNRNEI